ncbi:MAG: hypothetical protein ABW026_13695, partial [Microvirga sp.]
RRCCELRDLGDVPRPPMGAAAASATPLVDPFWIPMAWREGRCVWWRNRPTEEAALQAIGARG